MPHACTNCLKKEFSLFSELNHGELSILNRKRLCVDYAPGESIYKQGTRTDYLLCLNQGHVKMVQYTSSGKIQIIGLKKPTDFLGFADLMNEEIYTSSGIAINEVSICQIPKSDFQTILDQNPAFAQRVIKYFSREINRMNQRLASLTQKNLRGRLADTLILLLDLFGESEKDHFLNLALKREDLAALSNMDVSNASRILSEFSQEEVVELNKRQIKILKPEKLIAIRERN